MKCFPDHRTKSEQQFKKILCFNVVFLLKAVPSTAVSGLKLRGPTIFHDLQYALFNKGISEGGQWLIFQNGSTLILNFRVLHESFVSEKVSPKGNDDGIFS